MRWSASLIPTLREDPQEAEIPSHKLMLRAGLIRKLAGGLYTFLPLGLRALRRVEQIVREEMDRAGALEVLMPALQPREVWDRSGRYETMGDVMFKLQDRQDRFMVLGPTHEEIITELASHELKSYRQLPKTFYQIQVKFRDEIRPRFGLMRAKEFIMKDAYSFDIGWTEADASYQAMYDAYVRIFERCGLRTKIVEADTGAMGGKWSHEFMVLADSGEDGLVECQSCAYAANLERAERKATTAEAFPDHEKPMAVVSTPGAKTIEEVSTFFKCKPNRLIKTLLYVTNQGPMAVLVPGDRDVNEHKLRQLLNLSQLEMADEETIQRVTGAPMGFSGPVQLKVPIYADLALRGYCGAITGANQADSHIINVDLARDASVTEYYDLCLVRGGDACPRCAAPLSEKRGIEVGHVFKLGTKYSESFHATYLDSNSAEQFLVMGCYGIGVTRTLQAIIEQRHDEKGILWPLSVAPYPLHLLVLNPNHAPSMEIAQKLTAALEPHADILFDDRNERPGVKFNDADLLGCPLRIVIGERALANGNIELKRRNADKPDLIPSEKAVEHVLNLLKNWKDEA